MSEEKVAARHKMLEMVLSLKSLTTWTVFFFLNFLLGHLGSWPDAAIQN